MHYKWDVYAEAEEVDIFSEDYKVMEENIDVTDLLGGTNEKFIETTTVAPSDEQDEQQGSPKCVKKVKKLWITKGFLKHYRCLVNFSGFRQLKVVFHPTTFGSNKLLA